MVFLKRVVVIVCALFFFAGKAYPSEIMLRIASLQADLLEDYREPRKLFTIERSIDYSALASAMTQPVAGPFVDGLVQIVARQVPPILQELYPEQGRVVGQRRPGTGGGFHCFLIEYKPGVSAVFIELGAQDAVLGSLKTGVAGSELYLHPIQQYSHGSRLESPAVFTLGYSAFVQQLSRGAATEWLDWIMPLKNGVGVLTLRRGGAETRTDALILRIDPSRLPRPVQGVRPEVHIVLGWESAN